ncbi:hypothetical protein NE172_05175 [Clostridium botulinum]|nr:hypothetical protein [Clostridium botulinum]EES47853.1 hypothetical protein CLO_1405 [Clostridium botulinum E1 str. 'BoNT E Beluga']MBY6760553.1 hypothetical protein [Clostridium botulinum]MBY6919460.1 hypothetical protein [Clostridium botulinum]MCR1130338.1 hypothetical protein [Clostridium botulinum]HBZ6635756.1 hypothetical protein [Clostridium botulinum]
MCTIKCPLFTNKDHYLNKKIKNRESRKIHLLNFCCGKFERCEFYKNK